MRLVSRAVPLLVGVFALAVPASAAGDSPVSYTVQYLPSENANNYSATAINNRLDVVGGYGHATIYHNQTLTDLGTLGGLYSGAFGVNDRGQVVGYSLSTDQHMYGFVWQKGQMTQLSGINGGDSMAQAINANGDIAGQCNLPGYNVYHACIWKNGQVIDLGTLGGVRSSAFGINNSDEVVGVSELSDSQYHAFVWQNGVMTDLGTLGGPNSIATGVNDAGHITGWAMFSSSEGQAFIWKGGAMSPIGTLGGPGSYANAINNSDEIVGESNQSGNAPYNQPNAFIWQNGVMADLGTPGQYSVANGINDSGYVVGELGNGPYQPVIWQPQQN